MLRGGLAGTLTAAGSAWTPAQETAIALAGARRDQPSVAVVGAGLAGLTCAYVLAKHGIASTVYEANPDRLGGRCWTSRGWAHGQTAEHGGEFIDTVQHSIRHLVAAPNHLRAWRRDLYFQVGGHNREIHVADDFELMIRTFLETRMVQIPRLGYVQYQDGGNTQRVRNKDIQRHVRFLRWKYDQRIHERFLALGVDDYIWDQAGGFSDFSRPNPTEVAVASVIAAV